MHILGFTLAYLMWRSESELDIKPWAT